MSEEKYLSELYWINGCDEGGDYCENCIDDKFKQCKPVDANCGKSIGGGGVGGLHETDYPATCKKCGAKLAHSLLFDSRKGDEGYVQTEAEWDIADKLWAKDNEASDV